MMKISHLFSNFYTPAVIPSNDIARTNQSDIIDPISAPIQTSYRAKQVVSEEDSYMNLLAKQQSVVPFVNIFFLVLHGSVRVANTYTSMTSRVWRRVENITRGTLKQDERKSCSSAFLRIRNLTEESTA